MTNAEKSANDVNLAETYGDVLLRVAANSIRRGIGQHRPLNLSANTYPHAVQEQRASFVTLESDGELKGCIGTVTPNRALVEDVAHNAYAAAFRDSRFEAVSAEILPSIDISISILSQISQLDTTCFEEILPRLRPGVDGVVFEDEHCRAVFLPQVWEHFSDPRQFLGALRHKAGAPYDDWPPTAKVEIFTVTSIPATRLVKVA